jgi:SAM-dependent methyltransferase
MIILSAFSSVLIDIVSFIGTLLVVVPLFIVAEIGLIRKPVMYEYPWLYKPLLVLFYGSFYKKRKKTFMEEINPSKTDRILELGCGDGSNCRKMTVKEYVGVDRSENMFIKNVPKNAKLVKASANNFKIDGKFDKIIMRDLLHHVGRKNTVLSTAVKHSKKGTKIYIWDAHLTGSWIKPAARHVLRVFDGECGEWFQKQEFIDYLSSIEGTKLIKFECHPQRNIMAVLEVTRP